MQDTTKKDLLTDINLTFLSGLALEIEAYLTDCESRNLSPKTIIRYTQALQEFSAYMAGVELEAIKPDDIRRFMLHLKAKGHNPGGVWTYYRTLKAFFRWLYAEDVLPVDLFKRIKPPKLNAEPLPPAELADIGKLLKVCTGDYAQRNKAILLTLLDTGLRANELCGLNLSDIDLQTGDIAVRAAIAKGGKPRTVFVSPKTRRELLRYLRNRPTPLDTEPALFMGMSGERLKYSGLRQIARRLSKIAGFKRAIPLHAFRRAFAINALRAKMDVISLQRIMGHSSLVTTQRYLKQVTDDLHEAHKAAAPVNRLKW